MINTLLDVDDSEIRCNDGSTVKYAWKKSSTNSTNWIVFLGGGGGCWDQKSCRKRWDETWAMHHHWMSSKNYLSSIDVFGLFSPDKEESPLWDANKAIINYCSSDYFFGNLKGKKLWNY